MRGRPGGEPRLDPVRWRRPGRSVLLRFAAIAALVATAAVVLWAGPGNCEPGKSACDTAARQSGCEPEQAACDATNSPDDCDPGQPTCGAATGPDGCRLDKAACTAAAGPNSSPVPDRSRSTRTAERSAVPPDSRSAVPPGSIGVPIRLAEPTALELVQPGDRVDVVRLPDTGASPQTIATAALVLAVTGAEDPTTGGLLVALTPAEAQRTVTTPGSGYAVLIRPDG